MLTKREVLKSGLAAGATLAAPFVASPARAQVISLRLQGSLPSALSSQKAFEQFGATVTQKSGGKLVVHTLPGGSGVNVTETIRAMQAGVVDGHHSSGSFLAGMEPAFAVLGDTGASFDTIDHRDRWWSEGGGEVLAREFYSQYGVHFVAPVFWQSEHIPSRKPLNGVADLKGLKIRVPPGLISDVLGKAGASVVNIATGDTFTAFQSGVVDATDWAFPSMNVDAGMYRVATYSINASHSMPTFEVSVAKAKWDAMPAELRQLFDAEVRAMSAKLRETVLSADQAALKKISAGGVTIITWPPEEIAKLRVITAQVQDELAAKSAMAKKIVDSLRAFQKAAG